MRSYNLVVPLKTMPDSRPNSVGKVYASLQTKMAQKPYLCGGKNLYGLGADHLTLEGGGAAVEVQKKKYSRKGKLNEKNSCTPINP